LVTFVLESVYYVWGTTVKTKRFFLEYTVY